MDYNETNKAESFNCFEKFTTEKSPKAIFNRNTKKQNMTLTAKTF